MDEFWFAVLVGFVAQLVDGSLGMAYGISATSLLLSSGVPPAVASATVHTAEVFSTGASALSHRHFGNIDKELFRKLTVAGVAGAVCGALVISYLPGDTMRPLIAAYLLLMGVVVVVKAFKTFPPRRVSNYIRRLGFGGAFVDAMGGGGWGPIVASTLMARGNDVRKTVGTVNASEFFVTTACALVFFGTLGVQQLTLVLGLALGAVFAAPLGAYVCKVAPHKPLMVVVGLLIIGLSLSTLVSVLG